MTRLLWFLKAAGLCTALFVLSGGIATGVVVQGDGGIEIQASVCQTSATCRLLRPASIKKRNNQGNPPTNGIDVTFFTISKEAQERQIA